MRVLTTLDAVAEALQANAIGIFPCDTIWGLIGRATPAVGRAINQLKQRTPEAPLIQLIHAPSQLPADVTITPAHHAAISKHWPGPVTLILPTQTGSVGVRQPNFPPLLNLLARTQWPIFSTSVNIHGSAPCTDGIPDTWTSMVDFVYRTEKPPGPVASRILDTTQQPFQWIR